MTLQERLATATERLERIKAQEQLTAAAEKLERASKERLHAEGRLISAQTTENAARREYFTAHEAVTPRPIVEVEVPEGFDHIGWYCHHRGIVDGSHVHTPHREPDSRNKRGWREVSSTISSFDYRTEITVEEAEKHCQYRVPVFIKKVQL